VPVIVFHSGTACNWKFQAVPFAPGNFWKFTPDFGRMESTLGVIENPLILTDLKENSTDLIYENIFNYIYDCNPP